MRRTVIIGAGASGLAAAISARRRGDDVILCERLATPGRKLLATGGGRCNLLNENLDASRYNHEARNLVKKAFAKHTAQDILKFFSSIGLHWCSENGKIFPVTNQSASVLTVLEAELLRIGCKFELGFQVNGIACHDGRFSIAGKDNAKISCDKLIVACGGRSYPSLGSDGSMMPVLERLGHKIVAQVPSGVPLVAKDQICHALQGQKIRARVSVTVGNLRGHEEEGDMIFTKYGLSGTAVIDVSRAASVAINRNGAECVTLTADMAPWMTEEELMSELTRKLSDGWDKEELLEGILPQKLALAAVRQAGATPKALTDFVKHRAFKIEGTRGWNESDFTAGGVAADAVDADTLESRHVKGMFLCGEVLDVDGTRGGFNLAWAWASGLIVGNPKS